MPLPSAVKLAVGGRGLRNEATKVISRPVQGNDVFVKPLGIRNKVCTLLSAYICFPFVCTQIKSPTKKCEAIACFTFALDGAAAWYEVFVVFFGCLNPPHHGSLPVYHPKRRMKRSENFISFRQTYTSTAFCSTRTLLTRIYCTLHALNNQDGAGSQRTKLDKQRDARLEKLSNAYGNFIILVS